MPGFRKDVMLEKASICQPQLQQQQEQDTMGKGCEGPSVMVDEQHCIILVDTAVSEGMLTVMPLRMIDHVQWQLIHVVFQGRNNPINDRDVRSCLEGR